MEIIKGFYVDFILVVVYLEYPEEKRLELNDDQFDQIKDYAYENGGRYTINGDSLPEWLLAQILLW